MTEHNSVIREFSPPVDKLHVLTLTPFYPTAEDDGQGCFVAEPLAWLTRLGVTNTIRVARPFYRSGPVANVDASTRWSRYFSFPAGWGLSTGGAFLFAGILGEIRCLHSSRPVHLIHAHAALPCGHAAWLLSRELGIPFVVTVHGLDAFSTRQVSGFAGKLCAHVSQSVYSAARSIICVSEHVRAGVLESVPKLAHATVVYNGVDPAMFAPAETEMQDPVILSVGNLIPVKGHALLLRAVAAIKTRFPRITVEIIGDGPERSHLEKLAVECGIGADVKFLGRKNRIQVADAMRRATIFALPSRYEALGCVYLEAMSSGKPAIACREQGIEEVIENGVNGCLINVDDLGGLTDALAGLLQDAERRRRIGTAARQTIVQGFSQVKQADHLFRVYQECLG